jgi:hypothetical protein
MVCRVNLITLHSKNLSQRVQTYSLSNRDATYCFGPYYDQGHAPRWLVFELGPFLVVFNVDKVIRSVVVFFLLVDTLASECNMPTFRNTMSYLHRFCSETSGYTAQTPGNHPKETIQHSQPCESLKSRVLRSISVVPSLSLRQCPVHGGCTCI